MAKRTTAFRWLGCLVLLSVVGYGRCDDDWSLGCYKQNTTTSCFNITAGDYHQSVNLTGETCVRACAALNTTIKFAGLTANGVCLCSESDTCLYKVKNTSCFYPTLSDGLYFKVYPVADVVSLHISVPVKALNEFNVTVNSSSIYSCSYTLDFDDGVKKTLTSTSLSTRHYYASAGTYKITLSSHVKCMPRDVTETVDSKYEEFGNVTLDCPDLVEMSDEETCELTVLKGSGLNVTKNDSHFNATMSDSLVETIGTLRSDGSDLVYMLSNGTYIMPFVSATDDKWLTAIKLNVFSSESITIQILSPGCPVDTKACLAGCVPSHEDCNGSRIYFPESSDGCCVLKTNVSTNSDNNTNYTVRAEFNLSGVEDSLFKLSTPVLMRRGDTIAFHTSVKASVDMVGHSNAYLLSYCGTKFGVGDTIAVSNGGMRQNQEVWVRLHFLTPSVLEIPIVPKLPRVHMVINVTSVPILEHVIVKEIVEVQERISGLEILSPNITTFYATLKSVNFLFKVANGSNVTYSLDPGDGTGPLNTTSYYTTSNNRTHVYQQRGNYTFNVTASNLINNISMNQTVKVVVDIRNLTFVKDPKKNPGEVGKPYSVSFSLEAGDSPVFQVDFGNNIILFYSCDEFANEKINVSNNYSGHGSYDIKVLVTSLVGTKLSINSTVEIISLIQNLSLYQVDTKNNNIPIKLNLIEEHTLGQRITIVANVSWGWPVHYNFSVFVHNGKPFKTNILNKKDNTSFVPNVGGLWKLVVVAWNVKSSENRSIEIDVFGGCDSMIDLYDRRPKNEPFHTKRGNNIRFNTNEKHSTNKSCKVPVYSCWTFNWTLLNVASGMPETVEYERDKRFFFVKEGTLGQGLYKVEMVATCNTTNRTNEAETYFNIEATKPVAIIIGGHSRDVTENKQIILDASTSYDPGVKLFNSSGLQFKWKCVSNCTNVKLRKQNTSKVEVDDTLLNGGDKFKLMVVVTTSFGDSSNTTQIIGIVNQSVPTTEIMCQVNCLPFVIPADRLSLKGRCQSSCENVNFTWTLFANETKVVLDPLTQTSTGLDQENFVLSANTLERNTEYSVELVAEKDGVSSKSIYEFKTSGELSGGKCEITPKNGTAFVTDFRVQCPGWKGGQSPLTYVIRYQSSFEVDANVSSIGDKHKNDKNAWILWYHGQEQNSPLNRLPAGQETNNSNISITVEIHGSYGEYAKRDLSVQVNKKEINSEMLIEDIDKLKSVDGKEEPQKVTQVASTIATALNNKDADGKTGEEIRTSLVQKLSTVDATTLPLIQQTSDAVKLSTYDSTEVPSKTQETAAKTLKKLSENLRNIASNPSTREGQKIDETGKNLLSSLSKLLDASLFTGKETSESFAPKEAKPNLYGTLSKKGDDLKKIGEATAVVVKEFDKIFELISTAIAKNKLNGERPTVVETRNFKVQLSKIKNAEEDQIRFLRNVKKDNGLNASISLPMATLNKNDSGVFTEIIAFNKNPYTSDIKHSHYIQPDVVSFTFRGENGEKIPLNNLNQDIEIKLPNRKNRIVYDMLNTSAETKNFLVYNFKIDEREYEELIMVDIRNANTAALKKATFYVKFGEQASPTNFDFRHKLGTKCAKCEYIEFNAQGNIVFIRAEEKLRSEKGIVSVGLLPCPADDNTKPGSCDSNKHGYSIFLQSISCRYWNHSDWIKDGCSVGNQSTPLQTSCLCNHLTAFSSYIVKPNPLTNFSAKDFEEGYVCFVAVVVIFMIYFVLLVWARRADRFDSTGVGVCALSDNRPHDRYRYEIAVWTGMRRNAGTGSEVSIILSGDKHDTSPRCLLNSDKPRFMRGSLEKFLLTTSQDIGSLYCIRVWHDNSDGSWFLSRVMVTDLQNDERYYFICDRWLAVDEDDGTVERLLPVASDEELADFHHLFYSRTKRGLSDTHLWVSVLNRPPQSIFTRIQRLSCCLCIIMTTMVANAMFYNTKSEPTADTTNFVGSYSFTWDEVYIGIVSSVIIVPVNMIILYIFRNVRPKPRKRRRESKISLEDLHSGYHNIRHSQSSFETLAQSPDSASRDSIAVDTGNIYSRLPSADMKKKRDERLSRWARFKRFVLPSSLPPWFVYVGWLILVLVTLGSSTVVVLYGMQFGNGRSLQWLFSIVISICEDVFVLQPLKVLVFALGFALLVKKPDEGEFEMLADYEIEDVQRGSISDPPNEKTQMPVSPRLPVKPDEHQLALMRKARLKERKMFFLIQEIMVHLIFTVVIALVTYGHKDFRAVHLFRHVDQLSTWTDKIKMANCALFEVEIFPKLSKMNNFSTFWNWTHEILLPKAFPEDVYNGANVPSYGFLDDGYNYLISRGRMRLLRVNNDSCKIAEEFEDTLDICLKDYSIFRQDEVCYRPRWNYFKKGKKKTPWCFQSWKNLDGYPFWGKFEMYSGSGYISELIPGSDNNASLYELESLKWLDRHARALFIEMTTYNANINLYTSITLLFEFPEFGGVSYFKNIVPMRLKLYVGAFAFFIFACEMVFLLFIVSYLYSAAKKLYQNRMAYFKNFWNVLDFLILVMSLSAIGVYLYRINTMTRLMRRVRDRKGEFVNFQYVTYWNEVLNCIMATVVCLTTVKLTKLMRFNLRISLFGKTLQDAKPALAGFSIQFGIVFFAYVMIGVLVFGYNVSQFKSIPSAIMSLGRVILGKSQFRELFIADPIIGPLFFFTYIMFVCWVLVTMFVAILNDSYHDVQDKCYGMSNDYEVVDFFIARFRAWSGLGGKNKKQIPADQRWRQAGVKVKAAAAIARHRSYKPSAENIAFEKTGDLMEKLEDSIRSLEKRVQLLSVHFE